MKIHEPQGEDALTLILDVTIEAPRASVWRCWTEAPLLKEWHCPRPWQVESADLDVRPGGRFNAVFVGPAGERHDHKGMFLAVEPMTRLVFTDGHTEGFIPAPKHFMTGFVELADDDERRTRMVWGARHASEADAKTHLEMGFREGWRSAAQQLEELARTVAGAEASPPATGLAPHLVCDGAADAIEFYKRAFGAREMMRLPGADGRLMHASVLINGAMVMLVDENRDYAMLGPKALKGTPVTLHLIVPDADAAIARAAAAGALVVMPAADMFWGDRYGQVEDPFGHRWAIASSLRKMTLDEITAAAPDFAKGA